MWMKTYPSMHTTILQNTHNKLFERALHAGLFTLMAAKAIKIINVLHSACVARSGIVINACASRNWFCILELTHNVRSTPLTTITTATLWKNH